MVKVNSAGMPWSIFGQRFNLPERRVVGFVRKQITSQKPRTTIVRNTPFVNKKIH